MSEAIPPIQQDPMQPGLMFYSILRPMGTLDAAGNVQYQPLATTQDMGQAIAIASQNVGAVLCVNCVLAKTGLNIPYQAPNTLAQPGATA